MGLFFFSFSCQTIREENMGYYETNNYDLKGELYEYDDWIFSRYDYVVCNNDRVCD